MTSPFSTIIRGFTFTDRILMYYNDIYTDSWWTLAELVMAANINHDRKEEDKVKIKVYDAKTKRFLKEEEFPQFVKVTLTSDLHRRLARLLSNTRPDTMGSENIENINQLKQIVPIMRSMPKFMRNRLVKQMRPLLEQGIPTSIPKEQQEEMIQDLVKMYVTLGTGTSHEEGKRQFEETRQEVERMT